VRVDSANSGTVSDLSTAISELQDFSPHLVIALDSDEFLEISDTLDNNWSSTATTEQQAHPPLYLLSPHLYNELGLLDISRAGNPSRKFAQRLIGVNFASAPPSNRAIYDDYLIRLKSEYASRQLTLDGTENFYDATWLTLYAVAGAGTPPSLTGKEVASGLQRLMSGPSWEVGPVDVANVLAVLAVPGATLSLEGTLGPPDFDVGAGLRTAHPTVWCIGGTFDNYSFLSDVLTYDADTDSLLGDDSPCTLAL